MQAEKVMMYYGYKSVMKGFNECYYVFENRLDGDKDRTFRLLLIDEYISWTNSMEKKEAEEVRKRMATLLFLSRSLNIHIVLGCQRGMAESFPYGSRDCLNVIFLGAPSKESIQSFCTADEYVMINPKGQGSGYVVFDGLLPKAITIPAVKSIDKLNKLLNDIVTI